MRPTSSDALFQFCQHALGKRTLLRLLRNDCGLPWHDLAAWIVCRGCLQIYFAVALIVGLLVSNWCPIVGAVTYKFRSSDTTRLSAMLLRFPIPTDVRTTTLALLRLYQSLRLLLESSENRNRVLWLITQLIAFTAFISLITASDLGISSCEKWRLVVSA